MTARQVWEAMLTELSKVNAPSMLLPDFNYFFNKAINQYINKRYQQYDLEQQTTDDLRVLKATALLDATKASASGPLAELAEWGAGSSKLFGATYVVTLPTDYFHLLNCICIYKMAKTHKCYDAGDYVQFAAKRLTADNWSIIINDYYNRPLPQRPYYYINNVNSYTQISTNPVKQQKVVTVTKVYPQTITYTETEEVDSKGGDSTKTITGYQLEISYDGIDVSYTTNRVTTITYTQNSNGVWIKTTTYIFTITETGYEELTIPVSVTTTDTIGGEDSVVQEVVPVTDLGTDNSVDIDGYTGAYYLTTTTTYTNIGTDAADAYDVSVTTDDNGYTTGTTGTSNFARTIDLNVLQSHRSISTVEKEAAYRYGNASAVNMEIRYGSDDSVYVLQKVLIDYIKVPQYIRLTQEQVNLTEDTSQIMEFPDYVCQEIINELTMLVMENTADPRLQSNYTISQSVGNSLAQQRIQQKAAAYDKATRAAE